MTHRRRLVTLLLAVAVSTACTSGPATAATADAQTPPPASNASQAPASAAGTVAETMDAGGYTYLRLKTDKGDLWVAATQLPVKVGERLTVPLDMPMENFRSNTLERSFPLIYFVVQVAREGESLLPSTPGPGPSMASHAASTGPLPAGERIAQPTGGVSIADIWKRRAALANTTVVVRGKVVKVNNGIMGRNWLHLQDGSGSAADGTNDLVVTTDAELTVGDIVTLSGPLAVAKDLGSGYAFEVLLEQAVVGRR
jgi:hypothetical protein